MPGAREILGTNPITSCDAGSITLTPSCAPADEKIDAYVCLPQATWTPAARKSRPPPTRKPSDDRSGRFFPTRGFLVAIAQKRGHTWEGRRRCVEQLRRVGYLRTSQRLLDPRADTTVPRTLNQASWLTPNETTLSLNKHTQRVP